MSTDLEELRKLAEKATPGPWRIDVMSGETFIVGHPAWPCERFGIDGEWNVAQIDEYDDCEANAAYIAAANPATILALVSELEALREAVAREAQWRDLALQFDGHRMEALSMLQYGRLCI